MKLWKQTESKRYNPKKAKPRPAAAASKRRIHPAESQRRLRIPGAGSAAPSFPARKHSSLKRRSASAHFLENSQWRRRCSCPHVTWQESEAGGSRFPPVSHWGSQAKVLHTHLCRRRRQPPAFICCLRSRTSRGSAPVGQKALQEAWSPAPAPAFSQQILRPSFAAAAIMDG